jgi:hypothetical protein
MCIAIFEFGMYIVTSSWDVSNLSWIHLLDTSLAGIVGDATRLFETGCGVDVNYQLDKIRILRFLVSIPT